MTEFENLLLDLQSKKVCPNAFPELRTLKFPCRGFHSRGIQCMNCSVSSKSRVAPEKSCPKRPLMDERRKINRPRKEPTEGRVKNKNLEELKETLRSIQSTLLSLKPTLGIVSGLADSYEPKKPVHPLIAVEEVFTQLKDNNVPSHCMLEATIKLNEIKAAVLPNCSVLHIFEDGGAMTYNTINFAGLAMVTLDDLLNGYDQCRPWYKFWHYIPCVISYAFSSYKELTGIIGAAVTTWGENEDRAKDIAYQVICKPSAFTLAVTPQQVLSEAYLCSKMTNQGSSRVI